MTLVEIMIAMLVLAVTLLAAAESLSSVSKYLDHSEQRYDLRQEAERISALMSQDMARSGWHLPSFDADEYRMGSIGNAAERQAERDRDREKVYYPYVLIQDPDVSGGRGGWLPVAADMFGNDTNPDWLNMDRAVDLRHAIRDPGLVLLDPDFPSTGVPRIPGLNGDPSDAYSWLSAVPDGRLRWQDSYYAGSQEMIFLRLSLGSWHPDPYQQFDEIIDFSGGTDADWNVDVATSFGGLSIAEWIERRAQTIYPTDSLAEARRKASADADALLNHDVIGVLRMSEVGWPTPAASGPERRIPWSRPGAPAGRQQVDAILTPSAWLQFDGFDPELRLRWEAKYPPDQVAVQDDPRTDGQRVHPTDLREYLYAVVPSPVGPGRLVRAYSVDLDDGNHVGRGAGVEVGDILSQHSYGSGVTCAFIVDEVLSDHVTRVVFDTYRTVEDESLGLHEVRVRLYMSTLAGVDGGLQRHFAEHIFTMRAGNTDRRIAQLRTHLGGTGVEPPF